MTVGNKVALGSLLVALIGGLFGLIAATLDAGARLGRLEEKVERLTSTIDMIAPPTVRLGNTDVKLQSSLAISGPAMISMPNGK